MVYRTSQTCLTLLCAQSRFGPGTVLLSLLGLSWSNSDQIACGQKSWFKDFTQQRRPFLVQSKAILYHSLIASRLAQNLDSSGPSQKVSLGSLESSSEIKSLHIFHLSKWSFPLSLLLTRIWESISMFLYQLSRLQLRKVKFCMSSNWSLL